MIKLYKDKITRVSDDKERTEQRLDSLSLIYCLNYPVEFAEEITLGDIFYYIKKEKELVESVFSSHMGHYPLDFYIVELEQESDFEQDLDYLEIHRHLEYDKKYDEITEWNDISGRKEKGEEKDVSFALDFTPLYELKDVPMRLNKEFIISTKADVKKGKVIKPKKLVKANLDFTVYDILSTILYEISFHGSPAKRSEKLEELNEIKAEVDEKLEKGEKLEDFTSLEDLKDLDELE